MEQIKQCTDCKVIKPLAAFYKSATHSLGVMCYCKPWFNKRAVQRWIKRKIDAIIHKGSKCQRCGLHLKILTTLCFEFHHQDQFAKDSDWSKMRLKSWAVIVKEPNKCILLCANCHRIVHSEDFPDQPKSHG